MAKITKIFGEKVPKWLQDDLLKASSISYHIKERVSKNFKDSNLYLSVGYANKKVPKCVSLGLKPIKKGTLNSKEWRIEGNADMTKIIQNLRSKCQTIEADLRVCFGI